MKFKKFINENIRVGSTTYKKEDVDSFLEMWSKLEKSCKNFLREIKTRNREAKLLLRGSSSARNWEIRNVRKDRVPKDMEYAWHNAFDEVFYNEYDFRARSEGLFCTGRFSTADGYGTEVFIIFPIGRYKYLWSDSIDDLYSMVNDGNADDKLEPDDDTISQWQNDYDEEYGEGANGYWNYEGSTYSSDAVEAIMDIRREMISEIEDEMSGLDEEEDQDEIQDLQTQIDNIEDGGIDADIERNLVWEPYETWDSYEETMREQWWNEVPESMYYDAAESIVKDGNYNDSKGLVRALGKGDGTEIMVKCDKFYMINYEFYDLVKEMLFGKGDPRQLSFDFNKR